MLAWLQVQVYDYTKNVASQTLATIYYNNTGIIFVFFCLSWTGAAMRAPNSLVQEWAFDTVTRILCSLTKRQEDITYMEEEV